MGQNRIGVAQLFAIAGDELAREADGAGHGDLLSQHRPHRHFEQNLALLNPSPLQGLGQ